ncbi:MAG TPA: NAD-dependent epimerase/dehydratase family protein [Solirubrobacter sp.]|nr:NAD-dependent epimerase/dehydratase family protein [Solirubrobacter sp.]
MRALVTGGAGFIGSHLVDALLDEGDQVTIVDHLNPARADVFEAARDRGAALVRADVTDVAAMADACARARPEVVFHLAAQIDVRRSVDDPSTDAHQNIGGTAAVLEAARHAGVRRLVLASTAGVYGDPERLPTPETAPIAPLSPYGAGKAAAESYLAMFTRLYGLSTLSLRMSNVYGPRQNPHGEAGVVAIFSAAAAEGRTVTIFGDGGQTRDFVFVADVVEAFLLAGHADVRGALNISTGTETSLTELAEVLRVQTVPGPARLGEIRRSSLDPSAAERALGWRARTPLAAGLELTRAAHLA